MDVRFSIAVRQRARLRNLIEAIPEEDWTPIPYWMDGAADVAETTYTPFQTKPDAAPVRLIVRRVKPTPGSQLALFARYSYHAFITDRDGETLELEADHRRHAEVENAIRDLKYGVGLNHMPSARFAANGAWLAVQVMAHNLARWTARIGLGPMPQHSALLSTLIPQSSQSPTLTDMNWPSGGSSRASFMAFSSGVWGTSSKELPPQHSTVPSLRTAQEWWEPASIWVKLPGGDSRSPMVSVRRSSSPCAPQQVMVPSPRSPQVWNRPAETWTNRASDSLAGPVSCVIPG